MTRESVSVFELVEAISGNWALLEHIRINVGMVDEHISCSADLNLNYLCD